MPRPAQAIVDSSTYAHGSWNWDVVELGTGKTLYARNENKLNLLGSTTKLFTVGTYYEEFGANSTLETPVYATGTRSGGSLTGDLVLVGSGDFILGGRGVLDGQLQYTEPDHVNASATPTAKPVAADPLAGLDRLASDVKAGGITSINGDVLVNDNLWNPYSPNQGVVKSIMVNDNLLDILISPGATVGDPVTINTMPKTQFFSVENQATTGAADGDSTLAASLGADNRVIVTGQLPLDAQQQDLAQFAPDPAAYARALFIEALQRAGVVVDAPLRAATDTLPPDSELTAANKVASLTSPPTSVLTKLVTKIDDNQGAETLLCLIAKKAGSRDCDSGGIPVVLSKITKAKIEPGTVNIYDGEGSDLDSATPVAMTQWLSYIHGQPFAAVFKAGLPDIDRDGRFMVKSGVTSRAENAPMPAMFVTAGQAGYMTTQRGKDAVVAVYALNGTYPTEGEGYPKDLHNIQVVLNQMQLSS